MSTVDSPLPDLGKLKIHYSTQFVGSKVLMCNRISPVIQGVEFVLPTGRSGIEHFQFVPKVNPKTAKILPEARGLGVPVVQSTRSREFSLH